MGKPEAVAGRRPWIVLLYFYVAALVGLGFVITGATEALFGAKAMLVPQLGVQSSSYDYTLRRDPQGTVVATDAERAAARERALDDRRGQGADDLVDGAILLLVGAPTLVWHLRRGRRVGVDPAPGHGVDPTSVAAP